MLVLKSFNCVNVKKYYIINFYKRYNDETQDGP